MEQKKRAIYNKKIKGYVDQIDRKSVDDAITLVAQLGSGCYVVYNQIIETDGIEIMVQIHIAQRNEMWDFSVMYNGRFVSDIVQALLIVRDKIFVSNGWQTQKQFDEDWGWINEVGLLC